MPVGWGRTGYLALEYHFELSAEKPRQGKLAGVLYSGKTVPGGPADWGCTRQSIDATPYRGKRIRFRAAVRLEPDDDGSAAWLWLGVDQPDPHKDNYLDNMHDRLIYGTTWARYDIVADVVDDATEIVYGLGLSNRGRAFIDDVSIEILGE